MGAVNLGTTSMPGKSDPKMFSQMVVVMVMNPRVRVESVKNHQTNKSKALGIPLKLTC